MHSLHGYGLKLQLPRGWSGEVYARGFSRRDELVVLHAGSFRLGPHDGFDPMGTIERGGRVVDARYGMRRGDAGISLFANNHLPGKGFPPLHGPLQVRPGDRTSLEGWPNGRAVYRRFVATGGRQVEVVATFGSQHPRPELVARVNDVLRSLAVGS
jgi:hypothetical protein